METASSSNLVTEFEDEDLVLYPMKTQGSLLKTVQINELHEKVMTINYGSYITMKVVRIKKEYNEDYTMSLPLSILTILNADFCKEVQNTAMCWTNLPNCGDKLVRL